MPFALSVFVCSSRRESVRPPIDLPLSAFYCVALIWWCREEMASGGGGGGGGGDQPKRGSVKDKVSHFFSCRSLFSFAESLLWDCGGVVMYS